MPLGRRQLRFYTDRCDIYKVRSIQQLTVDGDILFPSTSVTPDYSGVPYFHQSNPEIGVGDFFGRKNAEETVSLMDKIHFEADVDIDSGDYIRVTTLNSPIRYCWFILTEGSMPKTHYANKKSFFAKRTTGPNTI